MEHRDEPESHPEGLPLNSTTSIKSTTSRDLSAEPRVTLITVTNSEQCVLSSDSVEVVPVEEEAAPEKQVSGVTMTTAQDETLINEEIIKPGEDETLINNEETMKPAQDDDLKLESPQLAVVHPATETETEDVSC